MWWYLCGILKRSVEGNEFCLMMLFPKNYSALCHKIARKVLAILIEIHLKKALIQSKLKLTHVMYLIILLFKMSNKSLIFSNERPKTSTMFRVFLY